MQKECTQNSYNTNKCPEGKGRLCCNDCKDKNECRFVCINLWNEICVEKKYK